jgi:hypothetical protein
MGTVVTTEDARWASGEGGTALNVMEDGVSLPARVSLNFDSGIFAVDNPAQNRIDITAVPGPTGPQGPPGVGGGGVSPVRRGRPTLTLASAASPAFSASSFAGFVGTTMLGGSVVDYRGRTGPTNPSTGAAANFGWYFSTDHALTNAGIYLAVADVITGPWTPYNSGNTIYQDSGSGGGTEDPVVLYHDATQQYFMHYQTSNGAGIAEQVTRLAVSSNGATGWAANGILLDTPGGSTNWPGHGHTGYFRPAQMAESDYVGVSLMTSGNYSTLGLWRSRDMVRWVVDPRPLQLDMVDAGGDPARKITFIKYFTLYGVPWGIASNTTIGSGVGATLTKVLYSVVGSMTSDLRRFQGPPVPVILPDDPWETWSLAMHEVIVVDGQPYLAYGTATQFGIGALTLA